MAQNPKMVLALVWSTGAILLTELWEPYQMKHQFLQLKSFINNRKLDKFTLDSLLRFPVFYTSNITAKPKTSSCSVNPNYNLQDSQSKEEDLLL